MCSGDPTTFIAVNTLSVQVLAIEISLRGFASSRESFDPFTETARLLRLCEKIVSHPKFSKTFVFDVGIIPPLWLMIVLCPDMSLKRKGVKILRDMEPRVECVWNSGIIADDGDTLIASLESKQRSEATDYTLPNFARQTTQVTCDGVPRFFV